jgi:23S rRNA (adenine2503-C2)-methyltransferase
MSLEGPEVRKSGSPEVGQLDHAPLDILGLTFQEFTEAARFVLPKGHGIARDLYPLAVRDGQFIPREFPISIDSAALWEKHFSVALLDLVKVVEEDGEFGTTAKAILRTRDGYEVECVRIPMRHGDDNHTDYTLCISSQVGCKMGCTFCETGRMGLIRHLTAAEIVSEVVTVRATLGWQVKNIVFMGMGEALDNTDNVIQALKVLMDQRGLHYSQERITVCTSGHAEGIARLAQQQWKRMNLSISLNAANDDARSRIMPVNRKTPLAELQKILAAYPQRRNFTLGVNYCLMPGLNDARHDAAAIAEFCKPLGRIIINLIPYNPGNAPLTRAPSEEEIVQFIDWLREENLPVRRRITKGRSIMAACGQLGNVELRKKKA